MAMLTVRNLPDDIHLALCVRAAENGRSAEAEVCVILSDAVKPEGRVLVGDAMAALARASGVTNEDVDALANARDRTPAKPLRIE